jgi:hypothetical protein
MSNLNNNTIQLEALLAKVNALPEAGSGGTDTSDATATADEIFAGETAYTADGKVTGTFTIEDELNTQDNLIAQISTLVQQKANPQGGTDTSDATATAGDILSGKTAYVDGEKITGAIPSKVATTYMPSTSNQTIASGTYLTGTQTIKGDVNLKAENIAEGVSIFGITGTHSGGSGGGEGGITTASVEVIATGVTTFYYVGVNGLCSISGVRNTVEMVVPSICYAEIASNSYFLAINATGDCIPISSLSGSPISTAFSVTGAGSIIVPSQGMEV